MARACSSDSRISSLVATHGTRDPRSAPISGAMSIAGQSRASNASRADSGSAATRMMRMISSMLATASARPITTCARSRALFSSNFVRRVTTSSRKRMKICEHLRAGHQLGPAAIQRQHVDAERGLHRRVAIELVQHDIGDASRLSSITTRMPLRSDFVAQVGNAFDLLLAHQLGDLLDHRRLVHLIRNLGDDDRLAVLADVSMSVLARTMTSRGPSSGHCAPARPMIMPPVGKSGPGTISMQRVVVDRRIVDQRHAGVDDLAEVVRRNVGRHADGDAARAIDQQVRELRRQNRRLLLRAVIVVGWKSTVSLSMSSSRFARRAMRLRCSAWPPADRRRSSRSCPARRSAAGASRSPAPCARARHRSRSPCGW
jgi:hypothetical protein